MENEKLKADILTLTMVDNPRTERVALRDHVAGFLQEKSFVDEQKPRKKNTRMLVTEAGRDMTSDDTLDYLDQKDEEKANEENMKEERMAEREAKKAQRQLDEKAEAERKKKKMEDNQRQKKELVDGVVAPIRRIIEECRAGGLEAGETKKELINAQITRTSVGSALAAMETRYMEGVWQPEEKEGIEKTLNAARDYLKTRN
ncbi:hypothetical protein TrRE_jg3635 [Triparma retinervis]|uniref:Uncharacterized protein n=1 Tax=Triparma retinervis TaxID=2557542 RepID=A0A9W7G215_9STRA|nr:hypothetical protein TrRE_jg3635 [Triparma retinervis]